MRKLYHFVPVLALCFGFPGGFGNVLALEGKASIRDNPEASSAPLLVEGTVFRMKGEALTAFAKEHGPGEYIIQVEGDFDLKAHQVAVSRITLKEKL